MPEFRRRYTRSALSRRGGNPVQERKRLRKPAMGVVSVHQKRKRARALTVLETLLLSPSCLLSRSLVSISATARGGAPCPPMLPANSLGSVSLARTQSKRFLDCPFLVPRRPIIEVPLISLT